MKGREKKRGLALPSSPLGWREIEGDRTSLSLPLEGEGGPPKVGDEVDSQPNTFKQSYFSKRFFNSRSISAHTCLN